MAEQKPSGFRFRLPWLLQPALPTARESPTQPTRTTTQTSVASTPAQRRPFRPPGKAPAPPPPAVPPPTVVAQAPFSPRRSPPQSAASPPPPSVSPKSSVTKSPTGKTIDPVATQPAKETQATNETPAPATPPQKSPLSPSRQANSQPSPSQTPPPQSVSRKSSVPKSPKAKTTEPVIAQPDKETQTKPTTETTGLATPPLSQPLSPPTEPQSQPNPPQITTPSPISPKSSVSRSPIVKTTEPVAAQPAKETQTTTETKPTIETAGPATMPLSTPLSSPTEAQSQPSPPQIPPPSSPSVSPKSSKPKSPIAKTTEPVAAQPAKETQTTTETIPTIETARPAMPPKQPSPPQTPPPANQSEARTPPTSPSRLAYEPADKTSSLPSPPTKTTNEVSEIKGSTEVTGGKFPVDSYYTPQGNHLALDEKPREITEGRGTQTKSMDSHSMDIKSQKPKLKTATRVPLHREIKDDMPKFIHKIATSSEKQSMGERPASVITIAGDNTGASMYLGLDEIKRGYKLTTGMTAHDATINGDGSSRRDTEASESKEPKAVVNSNIQGINNSMVFNSSVTERNPGVHLSFYLDVANVNDSMMKNTESIEMRRAEVNISPPQSLVYDPSEWEFEADDPPQTSGKSIEIEVL